MLSLVEVTTSNEQVDSAAYFAQRAAEVSLTARVIQALSDAGLKTLAQLAFCVGQPGHLLPQTDFDNWANSLLQNMTIGEKASLRRLILESQTMLVATLKDMTEQPDGASLKKVGMAERNARMEKLKLQLKGVAISGPLEPSHALLDATMQQWDSRSLKHIGPEKCRSREEEVQNLKLAASTVSLEGGKLKLVDSSSLQDLEIEGSLDAEGWLTTFLSSSVGMCMSVTLIRSSNMSPGLRSLAIARSLCARSSERTSWRSPS